MINIGLFGVGTVGGSVVKELEDQLGKFNKESGQDIKIKKIVTKSGKKNLGNYEHSTNPSSIIDDEDIQIVVELIGGIDEAFDIIKRSLEKGKHVVTANKAVVDKYGVELQEIAAQNKAYFMFEGAVGGGIPIINSLKVGLSGNKTKEIYGIINGTTNFILTKMTKEGSSYEDALKEAQELGYAEADPTYDVEGLDTAQKISILASINFSTKIDSENVDTKGITGVTAEDIQFASELGYRIKLIAVAREINGGVDIRVSPMLVSKKHPLAHIDYSTNAVFLGGHTHVTLAGEGAGGNPTASAVISDIKSVVLNLGRDYKAVKYFGNEKINILGKDEISSEFYLNFHALNQPGVLNAISKIFSDRKVNIMQVIQKGRGEHVPLIIHVDKTPFKSMEDSLDLVDKSALKVESVYPILII
ncbi:homoserine dehydrogenase [Nanoarchaeota archaeon]